jgi:enoyl-CoA hydratase
MSLVEVHNHGAVRQLTMNRPEVHNALSRELLSQLQAALEDATDDPDTSVVILRGAGPSFSSGFDFGKGYGQGSARVDPWGDRERLRRMNAYLEAVWQCPLPIVAAVHGHCVAGGADLALHCDFIIAAADASIGYPPVRNLGVPPSNMWLYRLGAQQAKRLMFTGDRVSGTEAVELGLALGVCPVDQLDTVSLDLAQRMALVHRNLLMGNKASINRGIDLMGRAVLGRIAETEDALGHLTSAASEFRATVASKGLRPALRERDAPFAT